MKTSELKPGMVVSTTAKSITLAGSSGSQAWRGGTPDRIDYLYELTRPHPVHPDMLCTSEETERQRTEAYVRHAAERRMPRSWTVVRLNAASAVLRADEELYSGPWQVDRSGEPIGEWNRPSEAMEATLNFKRHERVDWTVLATEWTPKPQTA